LIEDEEEASDSLSPEEDAVVAADASNSVFVEVVE
jgi:hypothetical protein